MSASKKNNSKSAKSPAPATKPAASKAAAPTPAAPPAPAKPAAVAKAPARKPVRAAALQATASAPVATLAPAFVAEAPIPVQAVASAPIATTITARVDVGFGNTLYIRGDGPGLSWDKGLAMECVGPNLWRIALGEASRPYTFKFLLNDVQWSSGPDFTAVSGSAGTYAVEF